MARRPPRTAGKIGGYGRLSALRRNFAGWFYLKKLPGLLKKAFIS